MTRLETIRRYFIERFFATLLADPQLQGLRYPSELFDSNGNFNLSPDVSGFVRIPTPQNLEQRINSSQSQQERDDLTQFRQIVLLALSHITGGLVNLDLQSAMAVAGQFAPYLRHPDDQNFFPLGVEKLLNYQDGTLQATFYDQKGQTPLSGRIYELMFENPDIPNTTSFPTNPFIAKVPFAATVGITPNQPGFPKTPLSQGRLNLAAADARLNPGSFQPTLYVEIKSVLGSMVMNALYEQAASISGTYAPLRNNRIHKDPSPIAELQIAGIESTGTFSVAISNRGNNSVVPPTFSPLLLIYHGFYPLDDAARRRPKIETTNREFHHLAVGLMFFPQRQLEATVSRSGLAFVFTCEGPDVVRMFPINHPFLERRNDRGEVDPEGTHIAVYTTSSLKTQGYRYSSEISDPNKDIITESVGKDAPLPGRLAGAGTVAVFGCAVGAAGGGVATSPFAGVGALPGCLYGAAIAVVVFVLTSLFCYLLGCGDDPDSPQNQLGVVQPLPPADPTIQSETNSVGPPGAIVSPRTFTLKPIPHFPDRNLYGLHSDGERTLHIDDDPNSNEMLGWLAFPGGIGYQFDPQVPGKEDIAGSSVRNYFDLFTKKYIEVQKAQELVTYFGEN